MHSPISILALIFITCMGLDLSGQASSIVPAVNVTNASLPLSSDLETVVDSNGHRWKRGYYVDTDSSSGSNWGGSMMSKLKRRTSSLLGTKSKSPSSYGNYQQTEDDDYEVEDTDMAGSFWNLYSGGGGYGRGGGGYGKYVNKSAVGLLGFLSLLSLIQNGLSTTTMMAMMPAPAPPGRRRRSDQSTGEMNFQPQRDSRNEQDRIARLLIPLLVSVSSVRDKGTPMKCVLRQACQTNWQLVNQFGERGRSVGVMLSTGLSNILRKIGAKDISKLRYAGKAGRNGKDCNTLYWKC